MRFLSSWFLGTTLAGQLLVFPGDFSFAGARHSLAYARDKAAPLTPGLALAAQKNPKELKAVHRKVSDFSTGIFFETDGGAPGGACFRLFGHVTSPGFFENLKRIDDASGTRYIRGTETLTQFPDELRLRFSIHDIPCSLEIGRAQAYLTRSTMNSMRFDWYWKRGIELRPAQNGKVQLTTITKIAPYAADLADQLPNRYEWRYEIAVPSAGVPLTDDLVLILRGPGGKIAARVAAHM